MEEQNTPIVKTERTAQDYINAANAVIDVAEIAIGLIPGGGTAATVARKAIKYAPVAKQVISKLPDVAPAMEPVVHKAAATLQEKAPDVVNAAAGRVAGAVKGAQAAVSGAGGAADQSGDG